MVWVMVSSFRVVLSFWFESRANSQTPAVTTSSMWCPSCRPRDSYKLKASCAISSCVGERRRPVYFPIPRSPVVFPVIISASFFMTLFLLGHHCDACGLRMRTRNLCCGLSQPGLETGLAESCVIARNQCSFAEFRSRVKRFWVSDDFAGIFQCGQAPPN